MDLDFIFVFNQIWIEFDNIVLNFLTNFDSVLALQITVLNILFQWSFSNPSRLSVELCLWPAKQLCSFKHHVIKVTEL